MGAQVPVSHFSGAPRSAWVPGSCHEVSSGPSAGHTRAARQACRKAVRIMASVAMAVSIGLGADQRLDFATRVS
jgi:hypothetical protein